MRSSGPWEELRKWFLWEGTKKSIVLHVVILLLLLSPIAWRAVRGPRQPEPAREVMLVDLGKLSNEAPKTEKSTRKKPGPTKKEPRKQARRSSEAGGKQTRQTASGRKASQSVARPAVRAGRKWEPRRGEETVSFENGSKYKSYLLDIKQRIEDAWELPPEASGGALRLIFSVERSGRLSRVELLKSSNDARLDQSALAAVRRAAPFAPMPQGMDLARLHVKAGFRYQVREAYKSKKTAARH